MKLERMLCSPICLRKLLSKNFMIIEDDPAIRDELALLLENEGCQPLPVIDFDSVPGGADPD